MKKVLCWITKNKNVWKAIGNAIQIACSLATVFALFVGIREIDESIITRNSAYMPLIKVETIEDNFELKWDKNTKTPDGIVEEVKFNVFNIGNGHANKVQVKFDKEVLEEWEKVLEELNPGEKYNYTKNEEDFIKSISYILMGKENSVEVMIPKVYMECLTEIYLWSDITDDGPKELPSLSFEVCYQDIQGKVFTYGYTFNNWFEEKIAKESNAGKGAIVLKSELDDGVLKR